MTVMPEAAVSELEALPACFRCGSPGEIPIRPHNVALCAACYCAELATTVQLEPAPAC